MGPCLQGKWLAVGQGELGKVLGSMDSCVCHSNV